jgi:hypothetical protein
LTDFEPTPTIRAGLEIFPGQEQISGFEAQDWSTDQEALILSPVTTMEQIRWQYQSERQTRRESSRDVHMMR